MKKLTRLLLPFLIATSITAALASDHEIDLVYGNLIESFTTQGVPEAPLRKVLSYMHQNPETVKNQEYLTLIDFSEHSSVMRTI